LGPLWPATTGLGLGPSPHRGACDNPISRWCSAALPAADLAASAWPSSACLAFTACGRCGPEPACKLLHESAISHALVSAGQTCAAAAQSMAIPPREYVRTVRQRRLAARQAVQAGGARRGQIRLRTPPQRRLSSRQSSRAWWAFGPCGLRSIAARCRDQRMQPVRRCQTQ